MDFVAFAKDNWTVLTTNPWQFATVFVLGTFAAALWSRRTISNKDSELGIWKARAQDYEAKLKGATPDEVATRIESLEQTVARLRPLMLTAEQADDMTETLRNVTGTIRINRDGDDANVDPAYRQMVEIFERAGWRTEDLGTVLGQAEKPPCGRRLILRAHMDESFVATIVEAFRYAGVKIDQVNRPQETGVKVPQILFSAPYEPARWG